MPTGKKVTALIQTDSPTTDAIGGVTESFSTVETISKAVLISSSGIERLNQRKETVSVDYILYVNAKKSDRTVRSILESQIVKIGSRTFDILFVDDINQNNTHLKIDLREHT